MNYQNYLDEDLINQVKESIEDYDHNTFALVLINDQHPEYESVFDDLEMNHNFYTMNWKAEKEYSVRYLSGFDLDVSQINLKSILKDVYNDSCVVPSCIV